MNDAIQSTGRDALLVGIPLVILMLVGLFRLDELFSRPKKSLKRRRPSCQMNADGEPVLSDPDGRLSRTQFSASNQLGPSRQRSLDPEPAKRPRGAQKPLR